MPIRSLTAEAAACSLDTARWSVPRHAREGIESVLIHLPRCGAAERWSDEDREARAWQR